QLRDLRLPVYSFQFVQSSQFLNSVDQMPVSLYSPPSPRKASLRKFSPPMCQRIHATLAPAPSHGPEPCPPPAIMLSQHGPLLPGLWKSPSALGRSSPVSP